MDKKNLRRLTVMGILCAVSIVLVSIIHFPIFPAAAFSTSRAVARLNILLELTAPYVKVGGKVLALKGTAAQEELAEAKNAISRLGLQVEKVAEFPMDGTAHTVIVLKKVAPTPAAYPRHFSQIAKKPL